MKKVACARCRLMKKKCEDGEPCPKCLQDGVECVRRPPNEEEQRLKRESRRKKSGTKRRSPEKRARKTTVTATTECEEQLDTNTCDHSHEEEDESAFPSFMRPKRQKVSESPDDVATQSLLMLPRSKNPSPAFSPEQPFPTDEICFETKQHPSPAIFEEHVVFKFVDSLCHSSAETKREAVATLLSEGYDTVESILGASRKEIGNLNLKKAISNSILRKLSSQHAEELR